MDIWREYTADMLCLIARPHYETKLTSFSELFSTEQTDNRTADQIVDDLIKNLLS